MEEQPPSSLRPSHARQGEWRFFVLKIINPFVTRGAASNAAFQYLSRIFQFRPDSTTSLC